MSPQNFKSEDDARRVFDNLKKNADVVINILDKVISSSSSIFTRDYLISDFSGVRISLALNALKRLEETAIFYAADQQYFLNVSKGYLLGIKNQLIGYMFAKEEEVKASFDLVMTTPKEPSVLKKELSRLGAKKSLIKWTNEAFEDLVRKAQQEVIIMTPFLDKSGANYLLRLIRAKEPMVRMTIILRFLDSRNSEIYQEISSELSGVNIKVVDYSIEREGSNMLETFHAKAILADDRYCYLGSSNLDRYSIENSMELGALITGESVRILKNLMDIIVSISKEKIV
ncbi:MAG: phospholipase D-like domain-containing protein [Candidatus Thiodiazotropha sp.]